MEKVDRFFPEVGLNLTIWSGKFDGYHEQWLRWVDQDGNLLAVGEEERERDERAEAEAARLREKLRELGLDL